MKKQMIRLGLIQHGCTADRQANLERAVTLIRNAADEGAQVVLLQELFNTLYFCQTTDESFFDWAERVPSGLTETLCALAAELEIVLVAPFFERRAAGIYHNSLVVIDADGTLMGTYRKKHIPDDPGFHEKYYFTPGEDGYTVYETRYARIGPLICWDQWYPEAARIAALKGADLLVYPTAIGTLASEDEQTGAEFHDAWQVIQRSHAIANGCFVAAVNRTGTEGQITFWGRSFAAGPFGQILGEAGGEEETLLVDIDLSAIEKQRRTWPFLRDRRIDTYAPVLKRFDDE